MENIAIQKLQTINYALLHPKFSKNKDYARFARQRYDIKNTLLTSLKPLVNFLIKFVNIFAFKCHNLDNASLYSFWETHIYPPFNKFSAIIKKYPPKIKGKGL